MKSGLKNLIKVLIVLALMILALAGLTNLCALKDSDEKYHDFFAQAEPFDILFYGSSHVAEAIQAMDLWENQGYVSYNLGGQGSYIPVAYWVMRNSMDYTTPKLAVLDVFPAYQNDKTVPESGYGHKALDAFPLNKTKIEAIRDLWSDDYKTRMEYYNNFVIFHTRWNGLSEYEFTPDENNLCKGEEIWVNVGKEEPWELLPKGDYDFAETTGTQYIRKFIEYCQERNIQVLLIKVPYPSTVEYWGPNDQLYGNAVQQIADEYGVNYINFFYEDVINFDTDLADGHSHLNPSGAHKVTEYLGEYIKNHYDIPDRRQDPNYTSWNEDYARYTDHKVELLDQQNNLYNYLMLLYDSDYYSEIQIDSATRVDEQDGETAKLLENIKDFTKISYTEDLKYNDEKCDILIHVYDAKTHEELSTGAFSYAPVYDGNSKRIS